MIAGLFGVIGIAVCLFVPGAVEKAQGGKVAMLMAVILVCFGIAVFGTAKHTGSGSGCYTDWDGRTNSEVCD